MGPRLQPRRRRRRRSKTRRYLALGLTSRLDDAMLKVYTLSKCSTCRHATQWLRDHAISFTELPIREQPPTVAELKTVAKALGDTRRLFNTSGIEYRAQNLAEKLPDLDDEARLRLLAGNGSLVKRPFVVGDGAALVGFNADRWSEALAR